MSESILRPVGLPGALAAEWRKFRRQRLPWTAVVLVLAATALSALWAGRTDHGIPVNGFFVFSVSARWGFRTAGFLVLLLGATSVAGEATAGALKLVLVRPVGRITFLLAKVVLLVAFVAVLALLVTGAAWLLGNHYGGFGDVLEEDLIGNLIPRLEAARIGSKPQVAVGLATLGLLAFLGLGLLVSTLTTSSATAVMAAILTVLPLYILPPFLAPWDLDRDLFTFQATRHLERVTEFAKGFDELWDAAFVRPGITVPVVTFLALVLVALAIFRRKDVQL